MIMVELLLKKGADVATKDKNGLTLLHIVAQTEQISLAEFLIAKDADINAKDEYSGFIPLDYAQDGEPGMIELLERNGGICSSC